MDRSRLAIIIPALNEAQTIEAVVCQVQRYGVPLVVDDGSTDATAERAQRAGAQVLRHSANLGYDGALNSGFALAARNGYDFVITMDADGQHNPQLLEAYIEHLDQGVDLVLGVRHRLQRIAESIYSWVAHRVWQVSDPLCGMKAYKMALYHRYGHFDNCQSVGTELAIHAIADGSCFVELPIRTRPRTDAPRFGRTLAANYRILRAMLIVLGRYGRGRQQRPQA